MVNITSSISYNAWLQYKRNNSIYSKYFNEIVFDANGEVGTTAQSELINAAKRMFNIHPKIVKKPNLTNGIHLELIEQTDITKDRFNICNETYEIEETNGRIYIKSCTEYGILYGVFELLRLLQMNQLSEGMKIKETPKNQLRMINHWDNMDGSIERGYAGNSIFYSDSKIVKDKSRIEDYARLLASVGINALTINNVNVHKVETKLITEFLPEVKEIANIFRRYGIVLFLSINYSSPIEIGELSSADPLDDSVKNWWKETAQKIYEQIPDFGGFVVKADSEHRPGPFTYGRNHADGANMLGEALQPFGGLVIWRCFVYNCLQDWRDRKTDRARAAYDHFAPLDGKFLDNVILQVKNGPMDFQVREPVSPLIGVLKHTNQLLEFQVTQEDTGQQKHVCYLIPQWKEVLDFDTYANGEGTPIHSIVGNEVFDYKYSGIVAVSNIGNDMNWTGHDLAQANLYGYGRLCWDPTLTAEEITIEWITQTYGNNEKVISVIKDILLDSWGIYEKYTAPLGVGWMVNPNHHYGPNVDGYEYSLWGTYHYADRDGIGVDRTRETGTGYSQQYYEPNASMYNSLDTCPDELILFFHHVPYTYGLKSGKTVIQTIYDTHFEGVNDVKKIIEKWNSLQGIIDEERYESVLERLNHQFEHSKEWRDIINTYFYRKSGIADEHGRKIY